MAASRELPESPVVQGANEAIAYIVNAVTGRAPVSVTLTIYDITDADAPVDVTNTVTAGANAISGDAINTKRIGSLTAGNTYRADVRYVDADSNTFEPYFRIVCK